MVVSIGFIIWAVLVLRVDTGVPSIFPEDHNLNKGSEVLLRPFQQFSRKICSFISFNCVLKFN